MITEAKQAEEILEKDQADMIIIARELLRDPYFPLHAAQQLGVDVEWPPAIPAGEEVDHSIEYSVLRPGAVAARLNTKYFILNTGLWHSFFITQRIKTLCMKTLFFLAVIHLLCAGNTTNKKIEKKFTAAKVESVRSFADTVTLNGKWFLQPMLASDTAAGKVPFLQIDLAKKIFSGNTGCNTMRGGFQKTDSSLVFNENIVTTKMMCTGYNEAAFLKSLSHTNRYKIVKEVLVLMFDETELSRWSRKPPAKKVLST